MTTSGVTEAGREQLEVAIPTADERKGWMEASNQGELRVTDMGKQKVCNKQRGDIIHLL